MIRTTILLVLVVFTSCRTSQDIDFKKQIIDPVMNELEVDEIQHEIDNIFMLLTYALVHNDWQSDSIPRNQRRGYNIGALIVNSQNEPVFHSLNCINSKDDATQHGEVRAITSYLEKEKCFNLKDHTMYTSLEPCVMCAGMMTMTNVKKVVYGQNDVDYSKAFERLAIDTRPIGGFPPYPRTVNAFESKLNYAEQLDILYQKFLDSEDEKYLAKFLASQDAKSIFEAAEKEFLKLNIDFPENKAIYQLALSYYQNITR